MPWRWGEKDKDAGEGEKRTAGGVDKDGKTGGQRILEPSFLERMLRGVLKNSSASPLESSGIPLLSIVHIYSEWQCTAPRQALSCSSFTFEEINRPYTGLMETGAHPISPFVGFSHEIFMSDDFLGTQKHLLLSSLL